MTEYEKMVLSLLAEIVESSSPTPPRTNDRKRVKALLERVRLMVDLPKPPPPPLPTLPTPPKPKKCRSTKSPKA